VATLAVVVALVLVVLVQEMERQVPCAVGSVQVGTNAPMERHSHSQVSVCFCTGLGPKYEAVSRGRGTRKPQFSVHGKRRPQSRRRGPFTWLRGALPLDAPLPHQELQHRQQHFRRHSFSTCQGMKRTVSVPRQSEQCTRLPSVVADATGQRTRATWTRPQRSSHKSIVVCFLDGKRTFRKASRTGFFNPSLMFSQTESRIKTWWTQTLIQIRSFTDEVSKRFADARRRQPVDPAAANRPPLYPDGLYVLLGMWILTYLVVRLGQFVCDLLAFIVAIVVSVFYVPGQARQRRAKKTAELQVDAATSADGGRGAIPEDSASMNTLGSSSAARERQRLQAIAARETTEAESAEWINAAIRKMWRLYNTELSVTGKMILQDLIDANLKNNRPPFVQSVTVERLELHERALRLPSVEKLPTRSDGDLVLLVGVRYDGDAQLHLRVNFGVTQRASFAVPVVVSGLDIDSQLWIRARMIPEAPYLGDVNVALLRRPLIDLQLRPFKVVDVMEIPGLRPFLRKLLTCDIPDLFVLPRRMPILRLSSLEQLQRYARMGAWDGSRNDPCMGALTKARFRRRSESAAPGRDDLSTDDLSDAGESEPDILDDPSLDDGLLIVMLYGARNLSGTTSLGLSNPFCYISVDGITVRSKPDKSTSARSVRGQPIWNQLFELPVRNPNTARLHIEVADRYGLKHRIIGAFSMAVSALRDGQRRDMWVPLRGSVAAESRLHIGVQYQAYVDADNDDLLLLSSSSSSQALRSKAPNIDSIVSMTSLTRMFPLGVPRSSSTSAASAHTVDRDVHVDEANEQGVQASNHTTEENMTPVQVEVIQPPEKR